MSVEQEFAIQPGSLILVTGATGSVGGAVANEILKAGYRVRATARDDTKAGYLRETFHARYGAGSFETCRIEDMTCHEALLDAMQGCVGVVHTASNTSLSPDPDVVIPSSVNMTNAMLRAAAATPTVVRFVYTSSSSVLPPLDKPDAGGLITSASWASESVTQKGREKPYGPHNAGVVYTTSKILSERACWAFMTAGGSDNDKPGPGFVLNTVVPSTQLGRFVHPGLASSMNGLMLRVWRGDERAQAILHHVVSNPAAPTFLLNLEDSGLLHLAALAHADVRGERVLGIGERFDGDDVVDVMRGMDVARKLPGKTRGSVKREANDNVDKARMMEILRRFERTQVVGLEESIRQMVESVERVA